MQYVTFGRSGLRVSRLTLGAMTFGAGSGVWASIAGLGREQATALTRIAIERGVNLIDTADAYSQGASEKAVGEVLHDLHLDESQMLVATKVRLRTGSGPNQVGLSRSHIIRSVETSLERIGRSHIDLLQLHDRDALTPIDETLRALDDLVTQGKVRHIGVCNFTASELERVNAITSLAHWAKVTSNQVHYSMASRDIEHEVAPVARDHGMALMIWSPLAGGYLSGKYTANGGEPAKGRRTNLNFPPIDPVLADPIVHELRIVAEELRSTPAQVALAWLLGRKEVTTVIVGASNEAQLIANLQAEELELPPEQRARLDKVSQPKVPYPQWMQLFHDKDRL
ncbi:aryl-alcohol dehydrogenase-like predicted oxidoreductase [Caballeronia udeis]|uniref:Aryl-alcohol dehydrogenase-like predicted oxidoreductase n=1 Tax=Caballeronia udeis TaxID=1232866 RepID=A0ABW8MZV0_9BURK